MLVERLLGVGLYALLLIVFCNAIYVGKEGSSRKWLILYAVCLAVMGFFYVPAESADLFRLTTYMNSWSDLGFADVLERGFERSLPTYYAYFWLVGQAGVDGLLPAISALLFYLLTFSCFWDYQNRTGTANSSLALSLALFMSLGTFLQAISGIRSYLAFAMIFRAFYTECFRNRFPLLNLPYYLLAIGMHPAAVALVIIRLVFFLFQRAESNGARLVAMIAAFGGIAVFVTLGSSFIDAMADKVESYLDGGAYSYFWETLIHLIWIAFALYTFSKSRDLVGAHAGALANVRRFTILLVAISIVFLPFEYAIYLRFSALAAAFLPFLSMYVLDGESRLQDRRYRQTLIACGFVILLLASMRGDLSAYKFLEP